MEGVQCNDEYVLGIADNIITEALKHRKEIEKVNEYYYQDDDKDTVFIRHKKTKEYDYSESIKKFVELLRDTLKSMNKECRKKLIDAIDYLLSESFLVEFQRALKEIKREFNTE